MILSAEVAVLQRGDVGPAPGFLRNPRTSSHFDVASIPLSRIEPSVSVWRTQSKQTYVGANG
jgi:hypothetical protein